MEAITLVNDGSKENRRELDYYPTPPDVTHALMRFLELPPNLTVLEPACGEGHMSAVIRAYGHRVQSSDVRFTGFGLGGIDFLTHPDCGHHYDAIITNPPFNQSEQFIRHALKHADIVAMLLKSQYWHAAKRKKLFEENPPAYVLPLSWRPDFLFDLRKNGALPKKSGPTMEVNWTVWIKGQADTRYKILDKPKI